LLIDIDTVIRTDILSDISFADVVLFEQLIVENLYSDTTELEVQ